MAAEVSRVRLATRRTGGIDAESGMAGEVSRVRLTRRRTGGIQAASNINVESSSYEEGREKWSLYRRTTEHQLYVLEEFFKKCNNPDYEKMARLGNCLNMEIFRVGSWFASRRMQKKKNMSLESNKVTSQPGINTESSTGVIDVSSDENTIKDHKNMFNKVTSKSGVNTESSTGVIDDSSAENMIKDHKDNKPTAKLGKRSNTELPNFQTWFQNKKIQNKKSSMALEVSPRGICCQKSSMALEVSPRGICTASRENLDISGDEKVIKKSYRSRARKHELLVLENFFKECHHPSNKQVVELAKRLRWEPLKVKYWFNNKRSQTKIEKERDENSILRKELEKLRLENEVLKEVTKNPSSGISNNMASLIIQSVDVPASSETSVMFELASAAIEELVDMAQLDEPLWQGGHERETLNYEHYLQHYARCFRAKDDKSMREATREIAYLNIHSLALVEALMDGNEWAEMFPGLIASSTTTEVISSGVEGTPHGALKLMQAKLQVVSPLVPLRGVNFLRFCRNVAPDTWVVVDVSVETTAAVAEGSLSCRRHPSGCVVQDLPDGCSKVTWVEHTAYDKAAVHPLYRNLILSGLCFGAPRWLAALQRHCNCPAVVSTDPTVGIKVDVQRSTMKLAVNMTRSFCAAVVCSSAQGWRRLEAVGIAEDIRLTTQERVEEPGELTRMVIVASTSVWLPAAPRTLFNCLLKHHRDKWDVFSSGSSMQETVHIANGHNSGNAVSLFTAKGGSVGILQETYTDSAVSMVVCATVGVPEMGQLLDRGDTDIAVLLPTGVAILPDGRTTRGCLLTVGFPIAVNILPTGKLTKDSVKTVNSQVSDTLKNIKKALGCCH